MAPAHKPVGPLSEVDLAAQEEQIRSAMGSILDALQINWRSDANTMDTPDRVARMLVREACHGRVTAPPELKVFPVDRDRGSPSTVMVGPISFSSMCAHHFLPVLGRAWVGVQCHDVQLGLSKYARAIRWIMARPHMQEEATEQAADLLFDAVKPRALIILAKARHTCMTWRGVTDGPAEMSTMAIRGAFHQDQALLDRFLAQMGEG